MNKDEKINTDVSLFKSTTKISLRDPELNQVLTHIAKHPADPLYNSLILRGNVIPGKTALKELQEQLVRQYPKREVLYYTGESFNAFIQKQPVILLTNFHKLHPNLLAVLIEDLDITRFPVEEQTKMAAFLKQLVAQKIQVAASTQHGFEMPSAGQYYPLSRELWSWYMSGREYSVPSSSVIYTGEISHFLTQQQDQYNMQHCSNGKTSHLFGELYPGILSRGNGKKYGKGMKIAVGICWLSPQKNINSAEFPQAKCPLCGKEELIPYSCMASALSGAHVLQFYCACCQERIATNKLPDYYHMIRDYALNRTRSLLRR